MGAIFDTGQILGGRRQESGGLPTSGTESDLIFRRWRRPDFAAAVRAGRATPRRAALFAALYSNVAARPPGVEAPGIVYERWAPLWRAGVDLLKDLWEKDSLEELDDVGDLWEAAMRATCEEGEEEACVYALGRMTRKGTGIDFGHPFTLTDGNRLRAEWLWRLGWPGDARLQVDDAFGLMAAEKDGERWLQPVMVRNRRIERIGRADRHADPEAAEAQLREAVELIVSAREALGGTGPSVLGRDGKRIGPPNPRRGSAPSSLEDMTEVLGMRGVEFGRWLNQRERQLVLDRTFDAFYDLTQLLKVSGRAGSLWGRAGIAFGSRGMGPDVSGHFEPGNWVLHLDRSHGSGVLAHEFGHALDTALAEACGLGRGCLLTAGVAAGWDGHPIARLCRDVIRTMTVRDGRPTRFLEDARRFDLGRPAYWATPVEMFARSFEVWVHDALAAKGRRNDFLVGSVGEEVAGMEWRRMASPYPKGRDRQAVVEVMGEFLAIAVPMARDRLAGAAPGPFRISVASR